MPNKNFCVEIGLSDVWGQGKNFREHWHEHLQVFYIKAGKAYIQCEEKSYKIVAEDIVIINSKEMHYLESLDNHFQFYLIRIDFPFLFSNQVDLCQTKYLAPLSENLIIFKNLIRNDNEILFCLKEILREHSEQNHAYELAIKAHLINLVVILMRNATEKYITPKEANTKINNTKRFMEIFEYIENNYNQKISNEHLAEIAHVSSYYFCRLFKQMTGRTPTQYINDVRLKKSIELLKGRSCNVTECAISCGFNDINYFSRLFKQKYGISPSKFDHSTMR